MEVGQGPSWAVAPKGGGGHPSACTSTKSAYLFLYVIQLKVEDIITSFVVSLRPVKGSSGKFSSLFLLLPPPHTLCICACPLMRISSYIEQPSKYLVKFQQVSY
jgi:hypothetical protein